MFDEVQAAFERLSAWVEKGLGGGRKTDLGSLCDELGMTCSTSPSGGCCRLENGKDVEDTALVELKYVEDSLIFGVTQRHYSLIKRSSGRTSCRQWVMPVAVGHDDEMASGWPPVRVARIASMQAGRFHL